MPQDVLKVIVHDFRAVVVGFGLEYLPACLKAARPDNLLTKVHLGVGVLDAAMLFLDMSVVSGMEVERQTAAAAELARPLRIRRVDLVEVSLQVRFPTDPLADAILCAEGALQFRTGPVP